MTRQSVSELIDYLEKRDYVERVPDPRDRRAVLVRRTERGWNVNRVARNVVEELQAGWAQQLGREDFDALVRILRRLVAVIGQPLGPAGQQRTRQARAGR